MVMNHIVWQIDSKKITYQTTSPPSTYKSISKPISNIEGARSSNIRGEILGVLSIDLTSFWVRRITRLTTTPSAQESL